MRRIVFSVLALACACFVPAVPACSSSNDAATDNGDAAIPPNQIPGQACDPTLTSPCLAPASTCFSNVCTLEGDGGAVCVQVLEADACAGSMIGTGLDSGADDAPSTGSTDTCNSDLDCPISTSLDGAVTITFVCGFSAFDGCNATGVCILPSPPHTIDGAVETGCGCDGEPVAYVDDEYTSAPVQSPSPCPPKDSGTVDTGEDAGTSPGADAASDASVLDASTAPDDASSGD